MTMANAMDVHVGANKISALRCRSALRDAVRASLIALLAVPGVGLIATPAMAQALDFTTFSYPGSSVTTVTGIRGNNMTGNYSLVGGATGGLLYTLPSLTPAPYPTATSSGINLPGATTATPYGPSFGSASGILRVAGSYKTATSNDGNLGYLLRRRQRPRPAAHDAGRRTLAPSTRSPTATSATRSSATGTPPTLAPGNAFLYDIPSGTMTTINRPGAYQHHRLRRLWQPHRRRLQPRAGAVTRLHPQPEHRRLHDVRCAWHGHRGHAFRGHHQRRARQHLQSGGRFGRRHGRPRLGRPCRREWRGDLDRAFRWRQRDLGQFDLRQHRDRRLSS